MAKSLNMAVIGKNINYSKSPQIHTKINPNCSYQIINLNTIDELSTNINKYHLDAFNVTIPYKQTIIPYLDKLDSKAQKIGAVNTVIKQGTQLVGYNTDYDGFFKTIEPHLSTMSFGLILGNGGASQAVKAVLDDYNINYKVVSRTKKDKVISYQEAINEKKIDFIINTTPLGSTNYPNEKPIDLKLFPNLRLVIDLIYEPIMTPLLKQAEFLNITFYNGDKMLYEQALAAQMLIKTNR